MGVCNLLLLVVVAIGMREKRRKAAALAGAAGGGVELAAAEGFAVGDIVTVHGLRATPQHNGRDGRVQCFTTADGRYDVRLLESGMLLAVKPANLRRAGAVAAAQVRLEASAAGRGAVPTVSGAPVPPGRASLVSSIPIGLGKLRGSVPMGLPVSGGRRKSPPPAYSSGAAAAPPPAYSSGAAAAPPPAYGSGAAAASSSTPPGYATGLATGAPSATAPPVSVDTTGDGRVSAVAYDTTGDGRHDTIAQQHGSDGPTTRAGAATACPAAAAARGDLVIGIVQLGLSFLAFILSIVALAGGVADNYDGLKSAHWLGNSDTSLYGGWSHACIEFGSGTLCVENDWDEKGPLTAMGALSFLFALANLVLVAVKLFKPIKKLSMIGCGVCFLGMIFTLACFGIFAGSEHVSDALDQDGYSYGPGFGSSVTCFVFLLISLVLGVISLLRKSPPPAYSSGAAAAPAARMRQ